MKFKKKLEFACREKKWLEHSLSKAFPAIRERLRDSELLGDMEGQRVEDGIMLILIRFLMITTAKASISTC